MGIGLETWSLLVWSLASMVGAWALTWAYLTYARRHDLLDIPTERSSHTRPTPRGGGISVVAATTALTSIAIAWRPADVPFFMATSIGAIPIAVIGFMDDRRSVHPSRRLLVHFACAVWAVAWLGGLPPLQLGEQTLTFGWAGYVLAVLIIVWTLNLFNFMDGIDGIAASEAVFVGSAGATLMAFSGGPWIVSITGFILAAACLGFLVWNWPPARIFMGDVASGYIGYVIAVIALGAARDNAVGLLVWLILGGLFVVDATITLARRVGRRERLDQAHRTHAYQVLARRWGNHKHVTVLAIWVNVVWLLPCAAFAVAKPAIAGWVALAALTPLAIGVIWVGTRASNVAG